MKLFCFGLLVMVLANGGNGVLDKHQGLYINVANGDTYDEETIDIQQTHSQPLAGFSYQVKFIVLLLYSLALVIGSMAKFVIFKGVFVTGSP